MWRTLAIACVALLILSPPVARSDEEAEEAPTDEEMEGINNIVGDTIIVKAVKTQATEHAARLEAMSNRCETEIKEFFNELDGKLKTMDDLDNGIDRRLSEYEGKFKLYVSHADEEIVAGTGAWVYPFVALSFVFCLIAGGGYWKWREIKRKNFID